MRLYCARCQHAAIPLNINCAQVYACPQCGAVYVHRGSNIYSFAADLQGAQGVKELLNQNDLDALPPASKATPA